MAQKKYHGKKNVGRMKADGSELIANDLNAFANMPQEAIVKEYVKHPDSFAGTSLNDDIRGIDKQITIDQMGKGKGLKPKKV